MRSILRECQKSLGELIEFSAYFTAGRFATIPSMWLRATVLFEVGFAEGFDEANQFSEPELVRLEASANPTCKKAVALDVVRLLEFT